MRKTIIAFVAIMLAAVVYAQSLPVEIIERVNKAVEYIKTTGDISVFKQRHSEWSQDNFYIFVFNCDEGVNVAHPINPKLVGKKMVGLKDIKGNLFFLQMCEAARQPNGGWVEYWWPKPGTKIPVRKVTYVKQVPGYPYQVGAGIYNDDLSLDYLNSLVK